MKIGGSEVSLDLRRLELLVALAASASASSMPISPGPVDSARQANP
jgi:hypothetical protein